MPKLLASVVTLALALSLTACRISPQELPPPIPQLDVEFSRALNADEQLKVARRIAKSGNVNLLKDLEPWLTREDRHARGNAAFVMTALGDPRGLDTIIAMLTDRSVRPQGQGIPGGRFTVDRQVRADRYYAVHLCGELKDPRAVDALVPLMSDPEVNYKVAWALGQIGDKRAIRPLIAALTDDDARMRASAVSALVALHATEAVPQLRALLTDQAVVNINGRTTVAETAKAAIATLEKDGTPR